MLPGELVVRVVTEAVLVGVSPSAELKPSCKVRVKDAVTSESVPEVPAVVEEKSEVYTVDTAVTSVRVVTDVTQVSKAVTSVNSKVDNGAQWG